MTAPTRLPAPVLPPGLKEFPYDQPDSSELGGDDQ